MDHPARRNSYARALFGNAIAEFISLCNYSIVLAAVFAISAASSGVVSANAATISLFAYTGLVLLMDLARISVNWLPERMRHAGRSDQGDSTGLDRVGSTARSRRVYPGWSPTLRDVVRLMPRAAGSRWLEEAESLLFDVMPEQGRMVVRSYLLSLPETLLLMWSAEFSRRAGATLKSISNGGRERG